MMLRFVLTVFVFIPIVLASPFTEKKAVPPLASLAEDKLLKNQINDAKNAAAFNRLLSHIANVNEERWNSIKKLTSLQSVNPYPNHSDALRSNMEREESDSSESDSDSDNEKVVYLVIPDTTALKPASPQKTNVPKNPPVAPIAPPVPENPPVPQVPLLLPNNTNFIKIIQPIRSRTEPAQKPLTSEKRHKKHSEVNKSDYFSPRPQNESVNVSLNKDGWEFLRQSIERSCKSREVKKCRRACKDAVASACAVYDCRKKLKKSLKKNCKRSCKDQFQDTW